MDAFDRYEALREVLMEIHRLNVAAGHTVFNPAATDLLKEVMRELNLEREVEAE